MSGRQGTRKYTDILKKLMAVRLEGRPLVELFTEVPSSEDYPDYRQYVDTPISLAEINKRARLNAYDSDDDFITDFDLMAENAKAYNGDSNVVYDDALDILDFALVSLGRNLNRNTRFRQQNQVLVDIENYKSRGRQPAENFLEVPDREQYPDYYEVIENPTSILDVRRKLEKDGPCESWEEFKQLTEPIFKNALKYNAPNSQLYQDAHQLLGQLSKKISKNRQVPKFLHDAARDAGGGMGALKIRIRQPSQSASGGGDDDDSEKEPSDAEEDEEDASEDEEEPEVVEQRFESDDDDDFEADSEDMDDEDLPEVVGDEDEEMELDGAHPEDRDDSILGGPGMAPPPPQPIRVFDEIVYREPGSSISDAMLQLVTLSSLQPPLPPPGGSRQPPPPPAMDLVQVRMPASRKESFTTFATTLSGYHNTLKLVVFMNEMLRHIPSQLTVVLNGRKLPPLPHHNPAQQTSVLFEEFDLHLAPGLNQVTIIAIKAGELGFVRPAGPPPVVGSEHDEERMVLFLNLTR